MVSNLVSLSVWEKTRELLQQYLNTQHKTFIRLLELISTPRQTLVRGKNYLSIFPTPSNSKPFSTISSCSKLNVQPCLQSRTNTQTHYIPERERESALLCSFVLSVGKLVDKNRPVPSTFSSVLTVATDGCKQFSAGATAILNAQGRGRRKRSKIQPTLPKRSSGSRVVG